MAANIRHLVMFSGGVCSWAAARRVADRHGTKELVLLFADTQIEDEDLYRFVDEASQSIGARIVRVSDGRNPWDVMREQRVIANTRIDLCSRILKRELLTRWRDENCSKESTTVYLGLDWTEMHRVERVAARYAPWRYESPMAEAPYLTKRQMMDELRAAGIKPPRLYDMGFPHNNCGGFCVKAGQAAFAHLYRMMPDRYLWHERQEEELRAIVGDHAIMRDRAGGVARPLTMRELRQRLETNTQIDMFDWGGCGCAVDYGDDTTNTTNGG